MKKKHFLILLALAFIFGTGYLMGRDSAPVSDPVHTASSHSALSSVSTRRPTKAPTTAPTATPTRSLTKSPTKAPTAKPTKTPASVLSQPRSVQYIYNKNTHKFHKPGCSSVNDMAEHNKVYWYDSRNALMKKYPSAVPCKRCNP